MAHYCISTRLVQEGIALYKICKWLGHSSVLVTATYAHFCPAYDEDIEKLTLQTNDEAKALDRGVNSRYIIGE